MAAIYYAINLRYNMNAREMEICRLFTTEVTSDQGMQRYATAMNMEWKDYEDFMEKYGYRHPELLSKWTSRLFLYETLGILLKSGAVKAEKLYPLGGYGSIRFWEKFRDIIQNRRDQTWGSDYMVNAEYFVGEMFKIKMSNDAGFKDKMNNSLKTGKL